SSDLRAWSAMRARVITVTDCGVSRSDMVRPVAELLAPVVYDCVPSVVLSRPLARTLVDFSTTASSAPRACSDKDASTAAHDRCTASASGRRSEDSGEVRAPADATTATGR